MSISKYSEADSKLKLSQGFLHTFDFSFFVGGFYPTAPAKFTPMNPNFENFIEFYLYDLRGDVLQIIFISLSDKIINQLSCLLLHGCSTARC